MCTLNLVYPNLGVNQLDARASCRLRVIERQMAQLPLLGSAVWSPFSLPYACFALWQLLRMRVRKRFLLLLLLMAAVLSVAPLLFFVHRTLAIDGEWLTVECNPESQ